MTKVFCLVTLALPFAGVAYNAARHDYLGACVSAPARGLLWLLKHQAPLGFVAVIVYVAIAATRPMLWLGPWIILVVVGCVPGLGRLALPKRKPDTGDWWSEAVLLGAFRAAGLVKGDGVMLSRVGAPRHVDGRGTAVAVRLPAGVTYSRVVAQREALAAALRRPLAHVSITQAPTDPADVVRIAVMKPLVLDARDPHIVTALHDLPPDHDLTADWRRGIPIGRDTTGRDVTLPTYDVGLALIAGNPASGKTSLLWAIAATYAYDPDALLWVTDGKGATDDWGPLRARCAGYVMASDDTYEADLLDLLRTVQAEVRARLTAGGRDHPGGLLLLEEYLSHRHNLSKAGRDEFDRLVKVIAMQCRAANILVVAAVHQATVAEIPSVIRAQSAVRVCMRVGSGSDAAVILGHQPTAALPTVPGQAIVNTGGEDRAVRVDWLQKSQWPALAHRACTQHARTHPQPEPDRAPDRAPEYVPVHGHDGYTVCTATGNVRMPRLVCAARLIVEADPAEALAPAVLLSLLPEEVRPSSTKALAQALKGYGWSSRMVTLDGKRVRAYVAQDIRDHIAGPVRQASGTRPARTDAQEPAAR
ncbi:membrane hypothetical protein [Nostocoides japonicum T1-X7]|uniref:FtsK domain-containing protein n=1 Tax=Nostocoides japonicum T1-X7 TaxID=1194083 RepID=A0A077M4P1_9MICO|nr:hypothetical protein [Tetrasphaera japonica]CCH79079.1 membrane hypothetical protein [Tetrasphaera japonica T1-X7]